MLKKSFYRYLFFIILQLFLCRLSAQETRAYHSPEHEYKLANELFVKQQYAAAKEMFGKVYQAFDQTYDPRKQSALYHQAVCACLLYHEDAEGLVLSFVDLYPEYATIGKLWFHLGSYHFEKRQYKKAIAALEETNVKLLNKEETAAYQFKRGYAYFEMGLKQEAKPFLSAASKSDSQYKNKAIFYLSHIFYIENAYQKALEGFEQLLNVDGYTEIVPFYIAHIYFATGKYDSVVAKSDLLLEKTSAKRLPEVNKLIACANFQLKNYPQAIPYFENYMAAATHIPCQDYYMSGFCYHADKQYEKAINHLTKSVCSDDSLKQYAFFTLGDCYLKTNQKEFASRAFLSAYELHTNPYLTEDALYEYAKLQYELSTNLFSGAIAAFENYLNEYPNSNRKNDAESMLAHIYLTTKNYKAALISLDKIKNKDAALLKAHQRICCYRGMELFNDGNYVDARTHFDLAIANNFDPIVYAQAVFWRAETDYRQEAYANAKKGYNHFLALPKADLLQEYPMAFYNGGYAEFKNKEYRLAVNFFLEFQNFKSSIKNPQLFADASNRIGDCYFMLSDLPNARQFYQKVITEGIYDVDYALYQRAQTEGGSRQFETKINTLKQLQKSFPKSRYDADAQYDVANTYYAIGQNRVAINEFDAFIDKFPNHPLVSQAMLKIGSLYYNLEEDAEAIAEFKAIVEKFPNSEEAAIALKNIENISAAGGNVDDFFSYVKGLSFTSVTVTYQDSVTYNAALDKYFNHKFVEAEKGFDKYIDNFPQGVFLTNAHYYRAECAVSQNNFTKALPSYLYVTEHPGNGQLVAGALSGAAQILYVEKNYQDALKYFNLLSQQASLPTQTIDAMMGKMRCYYELQLYDSAIAAANVLLKDGKASAHFQTEAHAVIARSAMALKNFNMAREEYGILTKANVPEITSEAFYYLAFIEYQSDNLKDAEKKVFEVLTNISNDYWLAKSYILLGDIYLEKGNSYQAKYTYQSIIDNYDGDDLKTIATEKYNAIIAAEDEDTTPKVKQKLKNQNIKIENNGKDLDE